jgi:hypothetical protein
MENRTERDFRVDFCRGLALIVIFIDHVPGNPVANFTLHNFGFCDAAEVFVLISGISSYLAYGSKLDRMGLAGCAKVVGRRWIRLYGAHLLLLAGLWAAAVLASRHFLAVDYVEFLKLKWFQDNPRHALISALTLSYLPKYLDILPLYLVLLAVAPFLLALVKRDWRLALAISGTVYLAAWFSGVNFIEGKDSQGWYFNPLAWQFLYTIGMVACHLGRTSPATVPWNRRWLSMALAFLAFGVVSAAPWNLTGLVSYYPPFYLWPADKTFLAPLRLINVLALFYVFTFFVRPQAWVLRVRLATPLLWAGRHSLPIYGLGVVLSCAGYVAVTESAGAPLVHAAVNLFGILMLLSLATILEWYRSTRSQPSSAKTDSLAGPGTATWRRAPRGAQF